MWREDEILLKYKDKLNKYNYVSFDIFDTLLLRTVDKPQDIFLKLGYEAIQKGYSKKNLTPFEFQQIRVISQNKAFEKHRNRCQNNKVDNEISLIDIYNEIPKNIGDLNELMKLEIGVEIKHTYLNPVIYSLLKYLHSKGKTIFLISNMYLSYNEIKDILLGNEFDFPLIKELVVSSEIGINKTSGKLFEHVLNKYGINKNEIIHIGDNYNSDIQGAKKAGIEAIKYDVSVQDNTSIDIEKYKYGNVLSEIKSLRKITRNLTINYNEEEKFWFQFGSSIVGPVFTLFCDYVIDRAIEDNINIIKPFMREGVILEPLLKKSAKQKKYDCHIKSLYASRASTLNPSIDEINKNLLDQIFEIRNMRLIDIIEMFELDYDDFNKFKEYFNVYLSEISKDKIKIIIEYILDNYSYKLNYNCKKHRDTFVEYLKQEKVISKKSITVDLGYGGTIPENMEKILKIEDIDSDILHLIMLPSNRLNSKLQKGINIKSFTGLYNENIDLIEPIIPLKGVLEEVIMGEIGSTIGYKKSSSKIEPILDENRIPIEEFLYKKVCRDGILKFQELYYSCLSNKECIRNIYSRKREILSIITRFMKYPTYDESFKLLNLHHDNNFGTKAVERFYKETDFELLKKIGNENFLLKAKHMNVIWPEAILTLKEHMYIQKKIIRESYNMPRYYKEVLELVERLKEDKIDSIIIWGAGEIGQVCIHFLKKEGIEILALVDRKEWLWDSYIEEVPICSSQDIAKKHNKIKMNVLIASFGFIKDIEKDISKVIKEYNLYTLI